MQIYSDINNISFEHKQAIIAIGNFDGVHRGHQALINKAKEISQKQGLPVGVLTFEPHPRQLFQPDQHPARITPANMKADQLEKHNIDFLVSLPFDWDFASQSAEEFIQNILKNGLDASHIVIGYDFHFGQMRKGNAQTIKDAGFSVDIINQISDQNDESISSSRIRQIIRSGDMKSANELLGWEWEIKGKVVKGDQRGRELGYPTANVALKHTIHPAYGVYACLVQIEGEQEWLPAATNIGIRPMFEVAEGQVEAHILDFPFREIYGQTLRVKPVQRLRSEAKFNSLDDLIVQMEKDCSEARKILLHKK